MTESTPTTLTGTYPTTTIIGHAPAEPARFEAGYEQADARVFRSRLRLKADGTARVLLRGQIEDATRSWVDADSHGNVNIFTEVKPDLTSLTEVRVAIVPTGARVPTIDPSVRGTAARLGSVRGQHVYLLSVDGTLDRETYEDERRERRDQRVALDAARRAGVELDALDDED